MSDRESPGKHAKLIRDILQYCLENPDAKDTVDGIVKWWRLEGQVERATQPVQEAVEFLVLAGWLTKKQTGQSTVIYGLNKKKIEDIKKFLNELGT